MRASRRAASDQPRRVQLRRAKGWRMPANTAKVDRTTLFGNPFSVKEYGMIAPSPFTAPG